METRCVMELIDREALLRAYDAEHIGPPGRARMLIQKAMTIDAEPIRHEEWKLYGNDDDFGSTYYCSQCHFQLDSDLFYSIFKYCPNCGAKMDGERSNDQR